MEKAFFEIIGMRCAACQARIEAVLSGLEGVKKTHINLLKNEAFVIFDPNKIKSEEIILQITQIGYHAQRHNGPDKEDKNHYICLKWRLIVSIICTASLLYIAIDATIPWPFSLNLDMWHFGIHNSLIQFLLILPVILVNLSYFYHGLRTLFRGSPSMATLITIGAGAAILYSLTTLLQQYELLPFATNIAGSNERLYFELAAVILTVVTLGSYCEAKTKGKTSEAIIKLMHLAPKCVTKRDGNINRKVPLEDIRSGDVLVVKAGETIPLDGYIIEGHGVLNESTLTGEPLPVEKKCGEKVTGSTVNQSGYFLMKVTATGSNTVISNLIRLVDEATSSKAPITGMADHISRLFVPFVIFIAVASLLAWLFSGASFTFALGITMSVLVIACPFALGLATPLAIMMGSGQAALLGILFKSSHTLENLQNVEVVVFDKTGTLTTGKPVVTDYLVHTGSVQSLLQFTASLESFSEHPLASAILQECEKQELPLFPVTHYRTIRGQGITAQIDDLIFFAGNEGLMAAENIEIPGDILAKTKQLAQQGKTPLFVANSSVLLGVIALADPIKPHSFEAICRLKEMGKSVMMLTGDNPVTAQAIQRQAGIQSFMANVHPTEKEHHIQALQAQGHRVAMIGDGINDASALARADVGMAIGAGTDIAMEAADIVLIKSDLRDIVIAIELSQSVHKIIKQNLFLAFIYNIIGIPIAAGCFYSIWDLTLNPMIAAFVMTLSILSVSLNALRLKRFKPKLMSKMIVGDVTSHPPCSTIKCPPSGKMSDDIKTKYLLVDGMTCRRCQYRVMTALSSVPHVTEVNVDLRSKTATVMTNSTDNDLMRNAVENAGYRVNEIRMV